MLPALQSRSSRSLGLSPVRLMAVSLVLAASAQRVEAQEALGDSAWTVGRYDLARTAYERALASEPDAPRPNLRLGIMLSWEDQLDSALVHVARARAAVPEDADAMLIQARILAWDQQFDAALVRYDSAIAAHPEHREAIIGRARTLAWANRLREAAEAYAAMLSRNPEDLEAMTGAAQVASWRGTFGAAERQYRAVLAADPTYVEALVGLGYVYHWQLRDGPANRLSQQAMRADSSNKEARELHRAVRAAVRGGAELAANWSNDSDHNTNFWQTLAGSTPAAGGLRAFGSVGVLEASDRFRDATRTGGEAGLSYAVGKIQLTGAAGARRLSPDSADERTAATYRGRFSYRPVPALGVSAGYSRQPFDEIASLFERDLDYEVLDAGFDATPLARLTIYGSGSGAWFSDGNARDAFLLGVKRTFARRFFAGLFGRTLSYDRRGVGYFSPDRFNVYEAQAGYLLDTRAWAAGLSGGLGAQQVGRGSVTQTEWHIEGRLARQWGIGNRVEVFGAVTNSAVSSTTGAFRHRTAGILLRVGL